MGLWRRSLPHYHAGGDAIGLQKFGKAEFYRDFLKHLRYSADDFMIAPGIRGMVMCVFTLPSFPYVFKVIKDRFPPPKEMTRETVPVDR